MKLQVFLSVLIFILIFAVFGCSSNSYLAYTGSGIQCNEGLTQIVKPVGKQFVKVSLNPGDNQLPEGDYAYQGMTAFFYNPVSKLYMTVKETINLVAAAPKLYGRSPKPIPGSTATTPPPPLYSKSTSCVRNYNRSKVSNIRMKRSILTHFDFTNGQKVFKKDVGFHFDNAGTVVYDFDEQEVLITQSPEDFLKAQGFTTIEMYKTVGPVGQAYTDYQLIASTTPDAQSETVQVKVNLRFTATPNP